MSEQSEDVTADVGGQLFLGRIDIPPFVVAVAACDRAVLLLASLLRPAAAHSSLPKFFFGFPFSGFFFFFGFSNSGG